ncbi:hypothetical protein ACOBQX_30585 [Actinokineospora sp. G85]|uniref:hypothetical protein n=1 Tax=Actinokineospora sp. G85 TaxID=3406626 RepID=UPI003C714983
MVAPVTGATTGLSWALDSARAADQDQPAASAAACRNSAIPSTCWSGRTAKANRSARSA